MKILISNDDGIWAEGISSLSSVLAKSHEVYVCAPDRERSATGHSMSLHKPLMVTPMKASDINSNAQEKIDAEILIIVEGLIGNK